VAKGAFGCVFRPALRCADGSGGGGDGIVSKLSERAEALKEYNKTRDLTAVMRARVPNFENYFVVPASLCAPAPLTAEDLRGVDSTCSGEAGPLHTSARLLNDTLSDYLMINMVDGGVTFSSAASSHTTWPLSFVLRLLCDLLENGIQRLNAVGYLHFDIKNDNVVFDGRFVRLIDWGRAQLAAGLVSKSPLAETMTLVGQPVTYALFSKAFRDQLAARSDVSNERLVPVVLESVKRPHKGHEDGMAAACGVVLDDAFLRAQITAALNTFRHLRAIALDGDETAWEWEWDWPGYVALLQHNFDVYGWWALLLNLYQNATVLFRPADAAALYARRAELKQLFVRYLYTPAALVEPYDIPAMASEVRALAELVDAAAVSPPRPPPPRRRPLVSLPPSPPSSSPSLPSPPPLLKRGRRRLD